MLIVVPTALIQGKKEHHIYFKYTALHILYLKNNFDNDNLTLTIHKTFMQKSNIHLQPS